MLRGCFDRSSSPKSVQHQFSPNVINTLSRRKVIRIINKGKNFDLLTNSLN